MAEIKAKEELTGKVYASGKIVASFVSAKGSKGDKGDSSTITIGTTTTGESGTEAKVTNRGTSTAAIFDFVIPKGDKGDKGDRGADGTGVSILGSYASLSELQAAHPTGNIGDSYMIDGNLYVWSATTNTWNNVGSIKGEKGSPGIVVQENEPTDNDIYVWLDTDEEGEVLDYSTYENKIESVSVNGVVQSISNKNVDVKVPTKLSQLEDDTEIPDTLYALGADYAECFEWEDGNPDNEDRRCLFVAIVDGTRKIRKAMNGDDVLGITSIDASVVGNAAYKDDNAYSVVGMVGVMKVKDNGQCEVGSYVIPGDNGLAIPSTNEAGYKVTARYSDDLIEVLLAHDSEMISRIKDDIKVIEGKIENGVGDSLPVGTIVEYDGNDVPSGFELVEDKGEVYSTEEVRIGTWLGKPLYRKVINSTLADKINTLKTLATINGFDTIVDFKGYFTDGSYHYTIPFAYNGEDIMIIFDKKNSAIKEQHNYNGANSLTMYAIAEYTKTTD